MASNVKCTLVDACIWVAYLDKDDTQYDKAKQIVDKATQAGSLLITDYSIQETITVFLYKNQSAQVEQFLQMITADDRIEILSVDTSFLEQLIAFIQVHHYKPKISLTDWSLLFLTDLFDFQLTTFDKQLKNIWHRLARQ